MRNRAKEPGASQRSLTLSTTAIVILALPVFLGSITLSRLRAQSSAATADKPVFDAASIKQNKSDAPSSMNIPLLGDVYTPTGGLFSGTNIPLISYIYFAYNITGNQFQLLLPQLPKWVIADHFDIQARAEGNPTKNQMRLMVQSLLADRFKLAIHYETRQLPVLAAVLSKPGKLGPQLQPHPDDASCSTVPPAPAVSGSAPTVKPSTVAGGFPTVCGGIVAMPPSAPGRMRTGARNVPFGMLVSALAQMGNLDRPVLDQTGLSGTFDFTFEWTPEHRGPAVDSQGDESGPTLLEALKDQLGMKLESTTGPVDVPVIDHIEMPSEN
jgi:uncharacterized protein (TIGR03435 family)